MASEIREGNAGKIRSAASISEYLFLDRCGRGQRRQPREWSDEFRRQLGSGCARADDGDVELSRTHRIGLRICANARVDDAMVEPHRLLGCLERDGMLAHSRRAEIIRDAADRDDQRVIV